MERSFSDFFKDEDGDYSKAKFMAVAHELIEQGRDPRRVFLAMYRAALAASIASSLHEHYGLICAIHRDVSEYKPQLEQSLDQIISKEQQ